MRGRRVVVIGAGIVGAACARELALAGAHVEVVDRTHPAQGTSSHGEGNILVSDKGPGPELELARLSRRLWPEVLAELTDQLGPDAVRTVEWDPKGGIVLSTTAEGAQPLTAFAAAQAAVGITTEDLDAAALAAAEPYVTREATKAVHYPEDAQVQPVGAAVALLRSAVAAGAVLRLGSEVVGALTEGDTITGVRTAGGRRIPAALVVNATGPWAGTVAERLGVPLDIRPRRGEVLVTTPQPPTVHHKVYDADYVSAVGSDDATMQTSTVVESTHGGTVLIGSTRRRVGFDDAMGPTQYAAMAAGALRLFPSLAGVSIMRAYGGFRPYAPDHLPVIGSDPRMPGLWHATGHEGAGIGLSVGTARCLRELMAGEPTSCDVTEMAVRPSVMEVSR